MTEPSTTETPPPARKRVPRTAVVVRSSRVTPHMIRVVLGGEGLSGLPVGEFTDHYVKLLFAADGSPFEGSGEAGPGPAELRPITRTYTVRSWDAVAGELTIDFVNHGDKGLAGPWAARARPGDLIQLLGPGGAYAPSPVADWHLLAGDESALPAIGAALERLPAGVPARVFVEVASVEEEQADLSVSDGVELMWIHRGDGVPGKALVEAVRGATVPAGRGHVFVHGEAGAVRELRRHLRAVGALVPDLTSISGYWRCGATEDRWQGEKRAWNAAIEAEEAALAG